MDKVRNELCARAHPQPSPRVAESSSPSPPVPVPQSGPNRDVQLQTRSSNANTNANTNTNPSPWPIMNACGNSKIGFGYCATSLEAGDTGRKNQVFRTLEIYVLEFA